MKKGVLSEPLKGKTAVFVVYVDNFIDPPAAPNYRDVKNQITANFKNRVGYDVYNTLEKSANITDNRISFY